MSPGRDRASLSALVLLPVIVCFVLVPFIHHSQQSNDAGNTAAQQAARSMNLPLRFEANRGQSAAQVDFIVRSGEHTMFLGRDGFAITSLNERAAFAMKLVNSNTGAAAQPGPELPGYTNYFRGSDRSQWVRRVPGYEHVTYNDVYPGIDVTYYGNGGRIEYDFIVEAGADPRGIALKCDGVSTFAVDDDGCLAVRTGDAEVRFHAPYAYQRIDGDAVEVDARYVLADNRHVSFELGAYDAAATLIIDPLIQYSTFFGGNGTDTGYDIAVDSDGSAYITGATTSSNIHVTGNAFDPVGGVGGFFDPNDVFVAKIDSSGSALIYGTYLSGRFSEIGYSIAVDRDGCAYVVGATDSDDDPNTAMVDESFPLKNPLQAVYGGDTDLFVTKLNADGTDLVYSTYIGGDQMDRGNSEQEQPAIDVDFDGCAYVAGTTQSANFPFTVGAFMTSFPGPFAFKLNATGSAFEYATALGSNDFVFVWDMEVDTAGQATLCGFTGMANLPTTVGSIQPVKDNAEDGFVYKVNPTGTGLVYCTYIGGNSDDFFYALDLDLAGNAYLTGVSLSSTYPVTGGFVPPGGGGIITKINNDGSNIEYGFFIGTDVGLGIAVDLDRRATVVGEGPDGSSRDVVFTQFDENGLTEFETFWGDFFLDVPRGVAVDPAGTAFVTGQTSSASFPNDTVLNPNPLQPSISSVPDAFVVKIPRDVPTGIKPGTPARETRLEQNLPNPFNPTTTIRWTQAATGPTTLRIYDVSGRVVRTLVSGLRNAGPHTVQWDGSNNTGEQVASGTYFYELRTGSLVEARSMVLLK
jgi:hypothetical protein